MLTVVVEHGDFGLVVEKAGIMLPAKVGCSSIAQVFELVLAATDDPDGMTVVAVNKRQETEVATRNEVIAVFRLRASQHRY